MPTGVLSYVPSWCGFAGEAPSRGVLSGRAAPEHVGSSLDPEPCSLKALRPQRRFQTPKRRLTPESRWFTAPGWDHDWAFSWSGVHPTRRWSATTSRENYGAWSHAEHGRPLRRLCFGRRDGVRDAESSWGNTAPSAPLRSSRSDDGYSGFATRRESGVRGTSRNRRGARPPRACSRAYPSTSVGGAAPRLRASTRRPAP